ncbi:MAG: hypothetical protein GJ676_08485 [Rhodobacteraceae bacterium]|nr:hypothetical protein [Paracoccaceae bacterium]
MERRIAAILAADMVGYSRLIELDETGTLERQKRHRLDLIDPEINRHHGKIIKLTGDGLIAEFASVVEAVQFAVQVQQEMAVREADIPKDSRIQYRVAVHLGDVVFDEGDVYGDGVNIAARLESLADPGGVVVSGTAHDMLKSQVDVGYRPLGEKRLKNISTPVRVYEVTAPGTPIQPRGQTKRLLPVGAAVVALLMGAGWWMTRPDFAPVDPASMELQLPGKPSIAVLPFESRGADPDREWMADGTTDSIISTLSLAPDLVVIARSTSFSYKDREVNAADAARELGVRYILSGSVQAVGDKIRVTTELADAIEGRQIWSIQQDSAPEDLLDLQDAISRRVFEELSVALTVGEGTRNWIELSGGFENYVSVVNGRVEFQKFSPQGHAKAEQLWSELLRKEPDRAFAYYLMGFIHWQKTVIGISTDPAADWAKAMEYAQKALDIQEFGEAYTLAALLEQGKGNHDQAIEYADKAVALSPGSADANSLGGLVKAVGGQTREGLDLMELGMRMEPDYPEWLVAPVNYARLELGRIEDAKELAREVLKRDMQDIRAKPYAAALLTVAAVFEDDMEKARERAAYLLDIYPKASASESRRARATYKDQDFVERYVAALVAAGIPDR